MVDAIYAQREKRRQVGVAGKRIAKCSSARKSESERSSQFCLSLSFLTPFNSLLPYWMCSRLTSYTQFMQSVSGRATLNGNGRAE